MADTWELISQGAEAKVYRGDFLGKPAIIKERFKKKYRVPMLDQKLSSRRISQEVRSMARCRKFGIRAPAVYHIDLPRGLIFMEPVHEGVVLKKYLNTLDPVADSSVLEDVIKCVGVTIATLHDYDIIHGDLTTSNMIFNPANIELTLIDFGLSFISTLAEDKGVDLYVLERALLSSHPDTERLFEVLLESYNNSERKGEKERGREEVISKLDEVRMRGRKRLMIG